MNDLPRTPNWLDWNNEASLWLMTPGAQQRADHPQNKQIGVPVVFRHVQMVRFRRHCWEDYSIVVTDSVMISVIRTVHCVFSTHEYSPRLVFSNSQQNKCVFEACLLEAPLGPLWRRHLFTFNARGCVVDSRPQKLFYRLVMVINYSFFMVHIIQERVQNVTCSQ